MRKNDIKRLGDLLVDAEQEAADALMKACPFVDSADIEPLGAKWIAESEEGPMDTLVVELRIYMSATLEQVQRLSERFRMMSIDRYSACVHFEPWTVEVTRIVYNPKTKELYQS